MSVSKKLGWAGPSCARASISLLVVSADAEIGHEFAAAIRRAPRWHRWNQKPTVHVAADIKTVAEHAARSPLSVEMVFIMIEPHRIYGLQWVRDTLQHLQLEMRLARTILVDIHNVPPMEKANPQNVIDNFRREFKLHILRGRFKEPVDRERLADRACLMFEQFIGLENGIPNILCSMTSQVNTTILN